jgi:hypothetical protein
MMRASPEYNEYDKYDVYVYEYGYEYDDNDDDDDDGNDKDECTFIENMPPGCSALPLWLGGLGASRSSPPEAASRGATSPGPTCAVADSASCLRHRRAVYRAMAPHHGEPCPCRSSFPYKCNSFRIIVPNRSYLL